MRIEEKYVFEKSIIIDCKIEEIFSFHCDTNNLPKISPPGIKAEILYMSDKPLKLKSEIKIRLSKFGFYRDWHIKIENYQYPKLISDFQIKGLFNYWHHYHIFEEVENMVKMTDKIEYIPPFGFLGKLFNSIIKLQLNSMFNFRHAQTKKIFEGKI